MSDVNDERVEFRCSQCSKRLRARSGLVGKQFRCPNCGQTVVIPADNESNAIESKQGGSPSSELESWLGLGMETRHDSHLEKGSSDARSGDARSGDARSGERLSGGVKRPSLFDVDELVLETDPIADVEQRKAVAQQIQATKDAEKRKRAAEAQRRLEEKPGDVTPVPTRSRHQTSESKFHDGYTLLEPSDGSEARPSSPTKKNPSVFDEDLPELVESNESESASALPEIDLERMAAEFESEVSGGISDSMSSEEQLGGVEQSYRVSCPNCGTMQYVSRSAQGSSIKCPDCLIKFKVPPPPANWKPSSIQSRHKRFNEEKPLSQDEEIGEIDRRRHQRTEAMLKQAEVELEKEEKESQSFGTDFDTPGFLKQTFGFILDPVALGVVLGYGLAFALIFAMIQYGMSADESHWGRGVALFSLMTGPVLAVLFGLPLISAALAQLESVANNQNRVVDWPGFNVFDNLGDALGVSSALAAAAIPGFIIGTWIGGELEGSGRIQIAGVMMTTLVLFPIFLLSVLDNNSMLQLISSDVIRSIREVSEAWGSYYLKTLIVFAMTMFLWLFLLGEGKPALLAAVGGALLPGLVFFTFHQLGCLAGAIGESLSPLEEEPEAEKSTAESGGKESTRTRISKES